MRFVLRMVSRELRASWRRLLFFFICVAIGVGAIVATHDAMLIDLADRVIELQDGRVRD